MNFDHCCEIIRYQYVLIVKVQYSMYITQDQLTFLMHPPKLAVDDFFHILLLL